MRVIGGHYRRRRLQSLPGVETRPMLDRLRETLFNVLQNEIADKVFADLYAGTGAVGIEALSRGAREAVFVENSPKAADVLHSNLQSLGLEQQAVVAVSAVKKALGRIEADIYFLGPPYRATKEYEQTLQQLGENPPELVIAQHGKQHGLRDRYGKLQRVRLIEQGGNCLSFFRPESGAAAEA